jgi:peptide chain release factor subunit 1
MEIEQFGLKKLIKQLNGMRGNGTSMVTLIGRPREDTSKYNTLLTEEYGKAENIKSRVNRLSVQSAITSVRQKLKYYPNKLPDNGLVVFCGTIMLDNIKEKLVNYVFEPFRPIKTSLYLCDDKFHTQPLEDLLRTDEKYGYIVIDGKGALIGTLCGNDKNTIHYETVDLPKKHGRGGQSSVRFARLRIEKRHNYLRKVADLAIRFFLNENHRPNIRGMILAGSAEFKNELNECNMFDPNLKEIVVGIVDVAYGGENGFQQAIDKSSSLIGDVQYVKEKKLVSRFMEEIAMDSGKYVFGIDETFEALRAGAVETLLVWTDLPTTLNKVDAYRILKLENVSEEVNVLDWLLENYKRYGTQMMLVSDKSGEGMQFIKGFGGFGGITRWKCVLGGFDDDENSTAQKTSTTDEEEKIYENE